MVTCNASQSGVGRDVVSTLRCIAGSWHGLASFNCSTADTSSSRIHHTAADNDPSWTVGHFFLLDTFPYSQCWSHVILCWGPLRRVRNLKRTITRYFTTRAQLLSSVKTLDTTVLLKCFNSVISIHLYTACVPHVTTARRSYALDRVNLKV